MSNTKKKILSAVLTVVPVLCVLLILVALGEEIYAEYWAGVWEKAGVPDLREPGHPEFWLKSLCASALGLSCSLLHLRLFPDPPEKKEKTHGSKRETPSLPQDQEH